MKAYTTLTCDSLDTISSKILEFVSADIADKKTGWVFLDIKQLLKSIPELGNFFCQHKLHPMDAAVTILYDDLTTHMDTLPVVAKINFPVANTQGWVNRWYHIDQTTLDTCPRLIDHLGFPKEDITGLDLELLAEIPNMDQPIVFNSRIPHSVNKINPEQLPRVIASFTFRNQPTHLLA